MTPTSWLVVALGLFSATSAMAADFYAAPTGSANGNGGITQPWDLATALAQPSSVHPGDHIWVRGGTYHGSFTSSLNGSSTAPIVVRQYPGERAMIDGNGVGSGGVILILNGSWTWFWGLEVMNSNTNRYSPNPGANGGNGFGVYVFGTNLKCINMVIHDTDQGFGFWGFAQDSELNGNVIYNNGWMGPDRGHGHGIYVQNVTDPRRMIDNVIFNQFSHGIHGYTEGGSLNQLYVQGNISFNNGYLEGKFERNILIGSDTTAVAQNPTLLNNYTYFTPSRMLGENNVGYSAGCTNATIQNNYFAGGNALHLTNCTLLSVTGNTFYNTVGSTYSFPGNVYYTNSNPPAGTQVFVRPNQYETGRGNIAVFNWAHASSAGVDLSSIVAPSGSYQIVDAQNYFGPAIVSGTYTGGLVQIPMTGQVVAQPIGGVPAAPLPTEPEFGVFVVFSSGGVSNSGPVVSITSPAANQSVQGTVTLTATASSSAAIASVQFELDGATLGIPVTATPYQVSWDTTGSVNGSHTLSAVARDSAGNTGIATNVPVTVSNAASTASASFVKTDTSASGTWKGTYGADGFWINSDVASMPSYAQVTTTGTTYVWAASSQDTRCLQKGAANAPDRICPTWYGPSTFTMDVTATSGPHLFAFYALDYDRAGRSQRIDVLDPSTGATLDTRTMSGFSTGAYMLWNVTGHVQFRMTRITGPNAVIAGVFFGPGQGGAVSQPTITQNPASASVSVGHSATFTVGASGTGLSYQWQSIADGGSAFSNITGATSASYSTPTLAAGDNGSQYRCAVSNSAGSVTSSAATLTVSAVATGGASASFAGTNASLAGTWKGTYGGDGFWINGDGMSLPSYAQVTTTGTSYVWSPSTQDVRCLQKGAPTATDRIASTWYGASSFAIDVTLASAAQISLYALDYDGAKRSERIDVVDPSTGNTLDSRTISGFAAGEYVTWNITGHVQFRITNLTGPNAVVAGIFFGQGQSAGNSQPVITQNPVNANVSTGQAATFSVSATGGGLGYQWQSLPSGGSAFANIPGAASASYTAPALSPGDNGTQYRCVVTNSVGTALSTAATVTVTMSSLGSSASFVNADATTKGGWMGAYGSQGYAITGFGTAYPAYAQVNLSGTAIWNNGLSADPAAPAEGNGFGIMACWYAGSQFIFDLNLTDSATHRIALYMVDWLNGGRVETVTIADAATGTVLNSQVVSSFVTGEYLVWNIQGHVTITITRNAGPNPVVSGLFFQ